MTVGAEQNQATDDVRASNMYGAYSFSQLKDLQDQVGSQVTVFNNADQESTKRLRGPEFSYEHPIHHAGAGEHVYQALYPEHTSQPTQDAYGNDEQDAGRNDLMLDDRPRGEKSRLYRDPEKRREQNRRASQRARQRARQREEQVVMLQQQLHLMSSEMSTIQMELSQAIHVLKREQVLSAIRATNELDATAANPDARSYSFSHPQLRVDNNRRTHQQEQ